LGITHMFETERGELPGQVWLATVFRNSSKRQARSWQGGAAGKERQVPGRELLGGYRGERLGEARGFGEVLSPHGKIEADEVLCARLRFRLVSSVEPPVVRVASGRKTLAELAL
jgi:hypothetical protein